MEKMGGWWREGRRKVPGLGVSGTAPRVKWRRPHEPWKRPINMGTALGEGRAEFMMGPASAPAPAVVRDDGDDDPRALATCATTNRDERRRHGVGTLWLGAL